MPILVLVIFVLSLLGIHALVYRKLWDFGLGYTVRFSTAEAFEGERVYIREEITNKKFLPLPWLFTQLEAPQSFEFENEAKTPSGVFAIFAYRAVRRRHYFVPTKRGVYNLHEAVLDASDIMHMQNFRKTLDLRHMPRTRLMVFPKFLEDYPAVDLMLTQRESTIVTNKIINPDPFAFKGIREYQPTDGLKSINFKASAIQQELMVNIYSPTTHSKVVLVLNMDPINPWTPNEVFEQAIRLTATLAQHLIAMDAVVKIETNGRNQLTGQSMEIGFGAGDGHLYTMLEMLTFISTSYVPRPMAEVMENILDKESFFLFISPSTKEDFQTGFEEMRQRGIQAEIIDVSDILL